MAKAVTKVKTDRPQSVKEMVDKKMELSLQAQIFNAIENIPNQIIAPDKSNTGVRYALYALWKRVHAIAEKKAEAELKKMVEDGVIKDPKELIQAGEHNLGLGKEGALRMVVNVSVPKREFNFEWFAAKLLDEHKIPTLMTRQYMEDAKRPGLSQTRTISVLDKTGTKV